MTKHYTDKEVREFFYYCEEHKIHALKISASDREILSYVGRTICTTSANVSDVFSISIPSASTRLKRLLEKGYLKRFERLAKSGGIEYMYERS